MRLLKNSNVPARQDPDYSKAIRQRHAAILGICALVDSYPYTVEKWMPDLLTNILAEHTYDPVSCAVHVGKKDLMNNVLRFLFRRRFEDVPAISRRHIRILGTKIPNVSTTTNWLLYRPFSQDLPIVCYPACFDSIWLTCFQMLEYSYISNKSYVQISSEYIISSQ